MLNPPSITCSACKLDPGITLASEFDAFPEPSPNSSSLSSTLGPPPNSPCRKPCLGSSGSSQFSYIKKIIRLKYLK